MMLSDHEILANPQARKIFVLHSDDFDVVSRQSDIHALVVLSPELYDQLRRIVPDVRVILLAKCLSTEEGYIQRARERANKTQLLFRDTFPQALAIDGIEHWQIDYWYLLLEYSMRWDEIASNLSKVHISGKCLLPRPKSVAWRYGFHSAIPALSLMKRIQTTCDVEFIEYVPKHSKYIFKSPDFDSVPPLNNGKIAYLPATEYHKPHFQTLIDDFTLVINPVFYGVPYAGRMQVNQKNIKLSELRPIFKLLQREQLRLEQYFNVLTTNLVSDLLIGADIVKAQKKLFYSDFLCQLFTYFSIIKYFRNSRLTTLYLTDHGSVHHGPLISAAVKFGSSIKVLPHSYGINFPFPPLDNISFLSHYSQSYCWDRLSLRMNRTTPVYLPPETTFKSIVADEPRSYTLQTVGLLFNAVCYAQTCFVDYSRYLFDLEYIVFNILAKNLKVNLRFKPRNSIELSVSEVLSRMPSGGSVSSAKDLTSFFSGVDLVVMYGWPTSAGIGALDCDVPIIACPGGSSDRRFNTHFDEVLIESYTPHRIVNFIHCCVNDPQLFRDYGLSQKRNNARSRSLQRLM